MKRPPLKAALLSCALAALGVLVAAPVASASFHLIKIRAVFGGTSTLANNAFVELQMYQPGQTLVGGHSLRIYNHDATVSQAYSLGAALSVANAENQRTVLIGDDGTSIATPDYTDSFLTGHLESVAAGGAICWESFDCVSWGNFTGAALLPSPTGTPGGDGGGLLNNRVLARSIDGDCPSALDAADDTNDTAADFSDVAGFPVRNNAGAITENPCPNTSFIKRAKAKSSNRTPTLKLHSTEPNSTFQCKLDSGAFLPCLGTETFHVKRGKHTLQARAIDPQGAIDPTPVVDSFKVVKRKHHKRR